MTSRCQIYVAAVLDVFTHIIGHFQQDMKTEAAVKNNDFMRFMQDRDTADLGHTYTVSRNLIEKAKSNLWPVWLLFQRAHRLSPAIRTQLLECMDAFVESFHNLVIAALT